MKYSTFAAILILGITNLSGSPTWAGGFISSVKFTCDFKHKVPIVTNYGTCNLASITYVFVDPNAELPNTIDRFFKHTKLNTSSISTFSRKQPNACANLKDVAVNNAVNSATCFNQYVDQGVAHKLKSLMNAAALKTARNSSKAGPYNDSEQLPTYDSGWENGRSTGQPPFDRYDSTDANATTPGSDTNISPVPHAHE